MTAPAQQRVRHRRRVTRRRAVIGSVAALGLTGAAFATTSLLSTAGAASAWPTAKGTKPVSSTITVSGTYDGGYQRFYGSGALGGSGQDEGQDPIFQLKDGAVLKNVILGSPAADGVHCLGSCTLQNVWWEDVGEDAATFKGKSTSAVYTVHGGGARSASDKVFQFNGAGKLVVTKFQVSNFGKLVRTCGNCSTQYKNRSVIINDVDVTAPGKSIVGINSNFGETAALRKVRIHGDSSKKIKPCTRFQGNNTGAEPKELGTGPDGTHCRYTPSDLTYK
ncbi:pectate lyase [Streptomyces spinoverrucosus]|uniref:pectate lyase n=1 Tax=Streptomyces spinoverrucosus TaxID=284043 RepID=UPI0018C41447|nr:pectate lyase [Streptomyces spinoverrucosus]MBG0856299.1 pectate lyase [Streptomyces spinoverrucosus]